MQINIRLCVNDRGHYVAAERPHDGTGPSDEELYGYLPSGGSSHAFCNVTTDVTLPIQAPSLVGHVG